MNKLFGLIMLTGILTTGMTSCGDDAVELQFGPEQTPMLRFTNRLQLVVVDNNEPVRTYGSTLEFLEEGRITQLCLLVPTNDIVFGLALWDLTDTSRIRTIFVEADSGVVVCQEIDDAFITAGSRMAVTMTGPGLYDWDNNGGPLFPSTIGDVTILGGGYIDNPNGIRFPNEFFNNDYAGLADVVFEAKLE